MAITTQSILKRKATRVKNLITGEIMLWVIPYKRVVKVGETVYAGRTGYEYSPGYDQKGRNYDQLPVCGTETEDTTTPVVILPGLGFTVEADYELIPVTPPNPIVSYDLPDVSVEEGAVVTMRLYGNYADGTSGIVDEAEGSYAFVGNHPPSYYLSYGNYGRVVVTTTADSITQDTVLTIRFTATDGKTADGTVTVTNKGTTPTGPNTPPVVNKPNEFLTIRQGVAFDYPMPVSNDTFTDADGDPLTYTMEFSSDNGANYGALPSWTSYNPTTKRWSGTPPVVSGNSITYKFQLSASDGRGGIAHDPFNAISLPEN